MSSNFRTSQREEESEGLLVESKPIADFEVEEEPTNNVSSYEKRHQSPTTCTAIILLMMGLLRTTRWLDLLKRTAHFLTPSFLQGPEARAKIRPAKLHPTGFLDGMRGLAAFCVLVAHWSGWIYNNRYGYGAKHGYYNWARLPFICLFYHGFTQVTIFFVISGYVLSYRPIRLFRANETAKFNTVLTSTLFRRWARLFLPPAVSTLMIAMLLQLGVYGWVRRFNSDETFMINRVERHPPRNDRFFGELGLWMQQQVKFTEEFVWGNKKDRGLHYDGHLWTIPVEFRCSLFLFLTLIGTSRLRPAFRFGLVSIMIWHAWLSDRYDFILFLGGMILAECDLIRGAHAPPSLLPQQKATPAARQSRNWTITWWILSVIGLYLMSQPEEECRTTPGWRNLCKHIPDWWMGERADVWRWYQIIGSILWVGSVTRLRPWQWFYETALMQYLGKISYALYLVHGMCNHTIGHLISRFIWTHVTGIEGGWRHVGFVLSTAIFFPCCVWVADIFWRAVDIPMVNFAKWVEAKVNVKND